MSDGLRRSPSPTAIRRPVDPARADSDDHATRLAELLKGREVHVNLIPLNPTEGFDGHPPSEERVLEFQRVIKETAEIPVTVRQRRGIDVGAGCGQLAG